MNQQKIKNIKLSKKEKRKYTSLKILFWIRDHLRLGNYELNNLWTPKTH